MTEPKRSRRGFAAMNDATRRDIASRGGKAAHAAGTAHEYDADEAREAGRKGGVKTSADRVHMAEIGRRGGQKRGVNIREQQLEQNAVDAGIEAP